MNLYCNKCSKFANDNDIEMKLETDGKKSYPHVYCFDCGFKKLLIKNN